MKQSLHVVQMPMTIAASPESVDPKPQLTQKEAAEKLGVTRFWLNRVLRGRDSSIRLMRRYRELTNKPSPS